MRPSPLLLAALLTLTLGACRGEYGTDDPTVISDSSGVAIVTNDLTRLDASCSLDATPTVSIGEEDGGEEYLLTSVAGARRLSDGRIALANARSWQVRYYGPDGTYIRSTGRQGEGPGEFRQPYTLDVLPGDTIHVGDIDPFRYLVLAPDGAWVRTVDLKPMMINGPGASGVLDDGRLVAVVDGFPEGRRSGEFDLQKRVVQLHAADGTLIDTIAILDHGRQGSIAPHMYFTTMPMFESYSHLAADGDLIVTGHGSLTELRVLGTGEGTPLSRIIRWTGESREVTSADVDADKAREKRDFEAAGPNAPAFMRQAYETNTNSQRPVADVMPAMNGIRIGTDGRIWIRAYYVIGDTMPRKWIAFTREGRFDCRLQTPRFEGFLEFGPDYLLALEADSLGVERVKQFPLAKIR